MPLKEPPAYVALFVWREPWFVIFVACGCQWPGCETGYSSLWTWWNIHRSSAEPPPPVTRAHPGHGSTFHLSDGIPHGLQPETCLQIHPLIYPAGSESLPPDIVQHNRNTGARSAGAKPCCSAPVLPAEGWLIAVANEGPVPCNYSSEASLSTLESRGKCDTLVLEDVKLERRLSCSREVEAVFVHRQCVLSVRVGEDGSWTLTGEGIVWKMFPTWFTVCMREKKKTAESDTRLAIDVNLKRMQIVTLCMKEPVTLENIWTLWLVLLYVIRDG